MAMLDLLRSKKPTAQLAEIEAAIRAAEGELAQHNTRRPAEVTARMTGDPNDAARVQAIDDATVELDRRLRDLRAVEGEIRRRVDTEKATARQREIEGRPRNAAELRHDYLAQVQQVDEHAKGLAVAIRGLSRTAEKLAAELDDDGARRFLEPISRLHRFQSAIARSFAIDPTRSLTSANSLLGIPSHEIGPRVHWSAIDHEQAGLDDLCPYFTDPEEAAAAKERLKARNTIVAVIPLPGCFALVREERRRRRFRAVAPTLEPVSTVGAGDVLLAGFLAARFAERPFEDALRAAVAVASASTLEVGAGRFDPREASRLQGLIDVHELEAAAVDS